MVACTGTFEVGAPTLLVVAFDDGTPQVGLVEDTFRSLDPGMRDLVFLTGSTRSLPAPAVAVDVVGRALDRSAAVFLLRASGTAPAAYLRGFVIQGIDPADPVAFMEDPALSLTLANGGAGGEGLLDEHRGDEDYCLVDAQVSAEGRYLALFEERSACGGTAFRGIYVLDLEAAAVGADPMVAAFVSPEPGPAGIYLDPTGALDASERPTLYFIDPLTGVNAYRLDTGNTEDVAEGGVLFDPTSVVDLGRIGDALVLVEPDAYVLLDTTAEPAERIESAAGLTDIVSDPLGLAQSAMLLAGDRLVVHDDVTTDTFVLEASSPPRADASFDPVDRFLYLLGDAQIGVFDELTFEGTAIQVRSFGVPEIPNASVLTWTRAAPSTGP